MENIGKQIAEVTEKATHFVSQSLHLPHNVLVTGRIFITGSKDVVGYRTALRLINLGYPSVRIGAKNPSDVYKEIEKGAEVVEFCWNNEATYEPALEGVKIVFASLPYTENWAKNFPSFVRACEKSGVQYFVKVSFFHARNPSKPYQNVPLIELHGKCDELLSTSKIPYTILSASHFMSNALVMNHGGAFNQDKPVVLFGSSHAKNVNYVSPNDVAECAVRVLLFSKPHIGKEYTLTSLNPMSDDDVASAISKHCKRQVFYEDLPIDMFETKERTIGEPQWKVRDLVGLERIKASGLEEDIAFASHDVEKICKRKPETFTAYLEATDCMTPLESWICA